ncbi:MAG TPA: hypothetical protein VFX43_08120 [Chitinophagaceae bacterium]|nr:hypothetical protein [Chitinophagaceae bacterium]
MSEYYYQDDDSDDDEYHALPAGANPDTVLYTRLHRDIPGTFEKKAKRNGWDVHVYEGTDEYLPKARYTLIREVHRSFNETDLMEAQDQIGIVDEDGEIYDEYGLYVWRVGDPKEFFEDLNLRYVNETNRLIFDYQGYPDAGTMEVLKKAAKYKPPKPLNRWGSVLMYFGLQKQRQKEPYTWDFFKKS